LKIVSFNANGIRSATRKGFFDWFARQRIDILCIQELKAKTYQIDTKPFIRNGYNRYIFEAEKPGYSGVCIYTRIKPKKIIYGLGIEEFDKEGRYIEVRFNNLSVSSIYFPSGSSGEERQAAKFRFLDIFNSHISSLDKTKFSYIFCGDFNIAHKNIDIKNWRGNKKNSGFLPEEREWMTNMIDNLGYVDAFRKVNKKSDEYTWWSNRGRAREKNVGWRIDYQLVSPRLGNKITKASVYRKKLFSDHAPLIITYDIDSRSA
jgi:exodeoxyribonuclease-3|tara:strand:- start:3240 stop:4022 length:783 start_codon:yes stop_codon:yes gene_type:complete